MHSVFVTFWYANSVFVMLSVLCYAECICHVMIFRECICHVMIFRECIWHVIVCDIYYYIESVCPGLGMLRVCLSHHSNIILPQLSTLYCTLSLFACIIDNISL